MADQTATVIIDVSVNAADAGKRAIELSNQIVVLKDRQDALRKSGLQLGNEFRSNAQEIRKLESETRAYLNINKNAEGSVNSLRAQIIVLNNQYNALSKAERTATENGKILTKQLAALREEERKASQDAGNFSTSIGTYAKSFQSAFQNMLPFGSQLGRTVASVNSLSGAFTTLSGSIGTVGASITAAGFGVLAAVLGTIAFYLKDVDSVTDGVAQRFAGLKAGVNELGRSLLNLDFEGLVIRMRVASAEAEALTDLTQRLEDSQLAQSVKSAKSQAEVAKLRAEAMNRALDPAKRQALLKQAEDIDSEDLNRQKKLSDREVEFAQNSIIITGRLTKFQADELKKRGVDYALYLQNNLVRQGKVTDEQTKALAAAYNKQTSIQNEFTQRSERRNNLSERIAMQAEANQRRVQAELDKINEDRIKSELYTAQSILTIRQKEYTDINADIDKRKRAYEKYGADTTQLERERLMRINALQRQFSLQDHGTIRGNVRSAASIRIGGIQDPRQRAQASLDNQTSNDLQDIDKQIEAVTARIALGETGLNEVLQSYANKRTAIVEKSNQDQLKLIEDARDQRVQLQQNGYNDEQQNLIDHINFEAEQNDRRLDINASLANSYAGIADSAAQAFGKQTALGKAAFLAQRSFAIAEIIINSEREKSAIAARYAILELQAAAIPIAGIAIVAALKIAEGVEMGVVTAKEIGSVGAVLATTLGGFATGGMISGPGSGTSDSIIARVSNGESIINANSTAMFAPLLSAMNAAGGGVAFSNGGIAGSYVPTLSQGVSNGAMMGTLMQGWKPTVYVEDINYAQNKQAVNVANANF